MLAMHQILLAALCTAATHAAEGQKAEAAPAAGLSAYGAQPNPMGFHEGARRIVKCDGGFVTGFEAYMSHLGGFAEPTLNAVRLLCSSSRVQVEYETGSLPDSMVFGNLPPDVAALVQPQRVVCPAGLGVAAVDWRRVPGTEKDNTARIAGFAVHCGSESNPQPLVVDSKAGQTYPASLKCSGTAGAPAGSQARLTAVEVWHEQLLSGLHLMSCQAAAQ